MADEPKAPRKRAAKKAVAGEEKKTTKKAGSIPVPLFHYSKQRQQLKRLKLLKHQRVHPLR
jgi:hypothetical protein